MKPLSLLIIIIFLFFSINLCVLADENLIPEIKEEIGQVFRNT